MFKTIIPAILLTLAAGCASQAQPTTENTYAWYRGDDLAGGAVKTWKSADATGEAQTLNQVVGAPRATRVQTPNGEKSVLTLDGSSALWARNDRWKEINGDLSVVALVRLKSLENGFLFDGSTGAGLTRAQVRGGNWQLGSQPVSGSAPAVAGNADSNTLKAVANVWQTHAFVFRRDARTATHTVGGDTKSVNLSAASPLTGFIVGANGAAKNGLRADIAELMVFDRALSDAEIKSLSASLQTKWGTPEIVFDAEAVSADKTTLSAKLADKSKPLIWLWSGRSADKNLGNARNEPQLLAERVRWEMGRRRDIMIDTRAAATPDAKALETQLSRFHPNIVVLEVGEGDSASVLVERIRKSGAIPILSGQTAQSQALRKTAGETGAILVETSPRANAAQTSLEQTVSLMRALGIDDPNSATQKLLKN